MMHKKLETSYNYIRHEYDTNSNEIENYFTYFLCDMELQNEFSDMLDEEALATGDGGIQHLKKQTDQMKTSKDTMENDYNFLHLHCIILLLFILNWEMKCQKKMNASVWVFSILWWVQYYLV